MISCDYAPAVFLALVLDTGAVKGMGCAVPWPPAFGPRGGGRAQLGNNRRRRQSPVLGMVTGTGLQALGGGAGFLSLSFDGDWSRLAWAWCAEAARVHAHRDTAMVVRHGLSAEWQIKPVSRVDVRHGER